MPSPPGKTLQTSNLYKHSNFSTRLCILLTPLSFFNRQFSCFIFKFSSDVVSPVPEPNTSPTDLEDMAQSVSQPGSCSFSQQATSHCFLCAPRRTEIYISDLPSANVCFLQAWPPRELLYITTDWHRGGVKKNACWNKVKWIWLARHSSWASVLLANIRNQIT